jgi:hypothetical protein
MPDVFETYARVFHPAWDSTQDRSVTWSELAAEGGVELSARTPSSTVFGAPAGADPVARTAHEPLEGSLPEELAVELAGVLAEHTSTPDRCWFCFWEGHGVLWSSSHGPLVSDIEGEEPGEDWEKPRPPSAAERDRVLAATPEVRAPQHEYLLFSGPLSIVSALAEPDRWAPALNMWWPEDRAWLVSTEVDAITTYAGGSREAVEDLLRASEVEAVEARIDDPLDPRR